MKLRPVSKVRDLSGSEAVDQQMFIFTGVNFG